MGGKTEVLVMIIYVIIFLCLGWEKKVMGATEIQE